MRDCVKRLMREGYLELASEAVAHNEEWKVADSKWPR